MFSERVEKLREAAFAAKTALSLAMGDLKAKEDILFADPHNKEKLKVVKAARDKVKEGKKNLKDAVRVFAKEVVEELLEGL